MPSEHHAIFAPDPSLNTTLCSTAERGVLALRQNRDPFTLLNMRGVTKHGTKCVGSSRSTLTRQTESRRQEGAAVDAAVGGSASRLRQSFKA